MVDTASIALGSGLDRTLLRALQRPGRRCMPRELIPDLDPIPLQHLKLDLVQSGELKKGECEHRGEMFRCFNNTSALLKPKY